MEKNKFTSTFKSVDLKNDVERREPKRDSGVNMQRAESMKNIVEKEIVESIPTSDGGMILVTHYVKDVKDKDNTRLLERETRETKEHSSDGVKYFSDKKVETHEGDGGVRTKKTTTTTSKVKKTSYGGDMQKFDDTKYASTSFLSELSPERFPKFIPIGKTSSSSFISTSFSPIPNVSSTSRTNDLFKRKDYLDQFMPLSSSKRINEKTIAPTFAYELEDLTRQKGDTVCFEGTVNGTSPFDITWYLDGKVLDLDSHLESRVHEEIGYSEIRHTYVTDYKISLKINNCTQKDIGKYTLQVKNPAGDASSFAFLVIEGNLFQNNLLVY
jgi:hypothetical protein